MLNILGTLGGPLAGAILVLAGIHWLLNRTSLESGAKNIRGWRDEDE